jgi:hypothetical protein
MSVFTSKVTLDVPIPHDSPHSVTIRKLAPRHLDAAAKEAQRQAITEAKAIGPAFIKEMQALADKPETKDAAQRDPLLTYDRVTLIEKGATAWTYDEPLTRESIEDLDDETADVIARAVLKLAKPGLFQTEVEQEADRKNG